MEDKRFADEWLEDDGVLRGNGVSLVKTTKCRTLAFRDAADMPLSLVVGWVREHSLQLEQGVKVRVYRS